jgi:hypothetical protein
MDGGSLNLRNDELFNKLDSAPRKDLNKLIQLQKETSSNSIGKQIKDSVTAIEETLFTLDIINTDLEEKSTSKTTENTDYNNKTAFDLLVNNLKNNNSDNFIKKIEKLYNIFYKCYESEVTIKTKFDNKLQRSSIDEYVKNRILGRVMYNIHYLKNFTRHYEQEQFDNIIKKLQIIPKLHETRPTAVKKLKQELNTLTDANIITQEKCSEVYKIIEKEEGAEKAGVEGAEGAAVKETQAEAAAVVGGAGDAPVEAAEGEAGAEKEEKAENTNLYKKATNLADQIITESNLIIKNYVTLAIFIKLKTAKKEDKEDKEDHKYEQYAKRAGKNTYEILIKSNDNDNDKLKKQLLLKMLLIDYYMVRNIEDTVDYFALETYYRIIFGTELSYDLKLFEKNKYILTRLENLSAIYETIKTIAYDDTFRTLERLYFNKKLGHQNIFRIDTDTSLDIKVFEPQDVFKELHTTYDTEPEKILRELIIFDINNGIVDRKNFELFLNFIYDDKYIELYNCLSNIFNMIITLTDTLTEKTNLEEIQNIIRKYTESNSGKEVTSAPLPAGTAGTARTAGTAGTAGIAVASEIKGAEQTGNLAVANTRTKQGELVTEIIQVITELQEKITEENIKGIKDKIVPSIIKIKQIVGKYLSDINKSKQEAGQTRNPNKEANLAASSGQGADNSGEENKSELLKEIKQILNLNLNTSDDSKNINKIKDIFENYVSNNKIIGGSKIDIKREELEKNLNNTSLNDDLTESVTDNAKRKYKNLQRNITKLFNAKENIEQDDNKLLDQEYLDILQVFNIDDIKTASYKSLRENLYKIKNNEYFEDIKITNEDIYTFIATTYVLRVISLYITMWFIQIEIVKDVHSVIVAYIITYILLFILIYTFVNLSDNQLDTSKSFLYYFYTRVNFSYTRFIVHLGLLLLLIIIPFVIRTVDKESSSYKHISDIEKRYLYTFITNMSIIIWVILSIIAFFFK